MRSSIRSIASHNRETSVAAAELLAQLDTFEPAVIAFFAAHTHDGALIARLLRRRFPEAQVIGCSTAGEFSERATLNGGVTGLALSSSKVARAAVRLVRFDVEGVDAGIRGAAASLAAEMNMRSLREADPHRYVGIVLFDGINGREEEANEVLGNIAPTLSFVGGSAGDGLEFRATKVYCNDVASEHGAALLLIDSAVPFTVMKTCSFVPAEQLFQVTRADVKNRVVYELDGQPILDAYANALGYGPEEIDAAVFMSHPVGLMIDGQPWVRSPAKVLPDGGVRFFCNIAVGMEICLMNSTDLVDETRGALARAQESLGAPISGGLAFNCVLRRLEMDAKDLHGDFLRSFDGMQVGGFHTYGETWLGHINQTLTAVWFA